MIEHKRRYILEVARTIMLQMDIPKYLWSNAILTASYLINRMPSIPPWGEIPLRCLRIYALMWNFSHLQGCLVVSPLLRIYFQILINCLLVLLNVSLLDTLAHNEGISVLIHPLINILSADVTFFESQRYFEDNVSKSNVV